MSWRIGAAFAGLAAIVAVLGAQRVRYPEPGRVELWMESPGPIGVTMIQVFVGEQLVEHYQQQHGE